MPPHPLLSCTVLAISILATTWAPLVVLAGERMMTLEMHHRYSDKVRWWAESVSLNTSQWPEKGGVEYYAALVDHDRAFLRRRGLAEGSGSRGTLTFAGGNHTVRDDEMGFLHYVEVEIGTPMKKFFVALDTGSDHFWVPCDCQDYTPSKWPDNHEFNIFNSSSSTTNKKITCESPLCETKLTCNTRSDPCPYLVRYLTDNLSTSGVLMEDVLHLKTEASKSQAIDAKITIGCGKVQTGAFLEGVASNGIFGLGMQSISVPSTLSSAGLTADSFSMCFGRHGRGRISFGDKGSTDQLETAFTINTAHKTYTVTVRGTQVGNISVEKEFYTIVDSGSSFTILADPEYTKLTEAFNSQVEDKRISSSQDFHPFEYCYLSKASPRSHDKKITIPKVIFTMKGGSKFDVPSPAFAFVFQDKVIYCLGVLKSDSVNLFGQNFLWGLRVVFDRERLILGWKEFDCYDIDNSTISWNRKGTPNSARRSNIIWFLNFMTVLISFVLLYV